MGFLRSRLLATVLASAPLFVLAEARAQGAACAASPPPAAAKPYVLLLVDASGSMEEALGAAPSCNESAYPATKSGHLRCALYNAADALSGRARVGMMAFPGYRAIGTSGPATCGPTIDGATNGCSFPQRSCGTGVGTSRSSATMVVPIAQDNYWEPGSPVPGNSSALLAEVDNRCGDCRELPTAGASSPLNGALRDAFRYLSGTFTVDGTFAQTFTTPLRGAGVELPCRPVHVVMITDGVDTCDTDMDPNGTGAPNAAKRLLEGFTVGGVTWRVRTHVIQIGNTPQAYTTALATAGGTTLHVAPNDRALTAAITSIVGQAVPAETCDNLDNDCNGCVDEGFQHFCNRGKTPRTLPQLVDPATHSAAFCCASARGSMTDPPSSSTCLGSYRLQAPGAVERPVWLLPCAPESAATNTSQWLCDSGGEVCDELDNDCSGGPVPAPSAIDEGFTKCADAAGTLRCPAPETCDGRDNDCDGIADDGTGAGDTCTTAAGCTGVGACTAAGFACVASTRAEVCDGLDNDCDGLVDEIAAEDAIAPMVDVGMPCGTSLGQCQLGTTVCGERGTPAATVRCEGAVEPGAADPCDGKDNDCDGIIDEDVYPEVGTACTACGFAGSYECRGAVVCVNEQQVGDAEICNGQDDNCDGQIDENVPGVGEPCGTENSTCGRGVWVCGRGGDSSVTMRCERPATAPAATPEICDALDNDCDGTVDEDAECPGTDVCVRGTCEPASSRAVVDAGAAVPEPPPPAPTPPAGVDSPDSSGGGCNTHASDPGALLAVVGVLGALARRRRSEVA